MEESEYRHWQVERDAHDTAWLTLDKADSTSNTLNHDVLSELDSILERLDSDRPSAVVIQSAKSSGFIFGADVGEFSGLETADEGAAAAARGQAVCDKVAALSCPTVAAIDGYALGGGLELALACDYRVAVVGYDRNIGLPEVQLGIHPGFGGTVRSVALLGAPAALDLMLTGRLLSPVEARRIGLVDRTAPRESLRETVESLVASRPPRARAPWHLRLLGIGVVRPWLARSIRARVARKANPAHYPAPYAIIDLWLRYGAKGREAFEAETRSIGELFVTQTSRNLVRVFFLRERLRNLAPKATQAKHAHVVGAGTMGGDIAAWCALRGIEVSVQDRELKYVEPALARAKKLFERQLRAPGAADAAHERLEVDLEGARVPRADVIVEAIVERLDAKQGLFAELEAKAAADAILATNTSSIRLEDIASAMKDPSRLVGLHFFNPVAKLPLVEVIRTENTREDVLERAMSFVTQIGKLPLPCRSAPGFVVNRILTPYMLEALFAHADGYALETIDRAAEDFGMPTGPVELADRVGLDIALHVIDILGETLGSDAPAMLKDKVEAGDLGAKTGRGFYVFENNRPQKSRDYAKPDTELSDRLILAMVNESVACLDEGIVEDAELLDAGAVFGTGFAPFRGGPIRYARDEGIEAIVERLEGLASRFGSRFEPHPGWRRLRRDA